MSRKVHQVKRPTWESVNSVSRLKRVGITDPWMRTENQKIAKFLRLNGFEFWDDMCIADYSAFNGYTITFVKTLLLPPSQNQRLHFSWHWLDEQHIYWTGTLSGSYDFEPDRRTYHPYARFEVEYITSETMGKLPTYENSVLRSLQALKSWSPLNMVDSRWKVPMEDVS